MPLSPVKKAYPRDWDRFRVLFAPDARLIPTSQNQEGKLQYNAVSPADYIKNAEPYFLENGFFEKEIYRVKEEYGPIVHIFSTNPETPKMIRIISTAGSTVSNYSMMVKGGG